MQKATVRPGCGPAASPIPPAAAVGTFTAGRTSVVDFNGTLWVNTKFFCFAFAD